MTGLTAEQQFELRAKKALETGDASFKPRGQTNKALFEKMKEEFDKKAKEINSHTSSVGDRIVQETTATVLEAIGQNTQPNPERTRMAAIMAGSSTAVKVLNSILCELGKECKGTKTDKAEFLANNVPVHQLVRLLEEHKSCATSKPRAKGKAKADNKPAASSATASTAAPSEQMVESDRDEQCEDDVIYELPLPEDDESSEEAMPVPAPQESTKDAKQDEESSDESSDEAMPLPAKPTAAEPTPLESIPAKTAPTQTVPDVVYIPCKRKNADTTQQFEKIKVVFNKSCTDAEKEKITSPETPFAKVVDILKSCSSDEEGMWRFKREVNDLLNTGGYCVDPKTEREDTFSVSLRNSDTFEAVCMLSLV